MTVKYNKTKVDNFKAKLADFSNNKKEEYIDSIRNLNNIITTVINNYRAAPTDNSNTFYKDSNGQNYIRTPEKVLMRISQDMGGPVKTELTDISFNSLVNIDGDDCFYSNIEYKNTNNSNNNDKISNRYVQVGFGNDLSYNSSSHLDKIYEVDTNSTPKFKNEMDCDEEFLYKCDGFSKMTGSKYYGIGNNGTNDNCECYTMEETPSNSISEKILSIDVTEALLGNKDFSTSYLGIMMDGNAYALKESNFSNNFNNVYVPNSANHAAIFDSSVEKPNCNMYTGSGVYDVKINSLGETDCALKKIN